MSDHQATLAAWEANGRNARATARALNIHRSTFRDRLQRALEWQKQGGKAPLVQANAIHQQLREAERKLAQVEKENLTTQQIREYIFGLADWSPRTPEWVNSRRDYPYHHGIPTLFLSDLHQGEVVEPDKVFGANEFNSRISERRIKRVIDSTINLTYGILKDPKFPGIVLALGGDMVTGTIHEEIVVGSDRMIMSQTLDIADTLHACILKLLKHYGRVFIPGVPGNHGRTTRKPSFKFYAETNFDWLVYQMLERFFQNEINAGSIVFVTPAAQDVTFVVAGRRFRLSHGDQFRGGDGIIGPLGPITRGNNKKRSMALSLPTDGEQYDTLMVGHFHQLYQSHKLIINGSTKGFDEYALANNFEYEPPQQSLFLTHEKYGINHWLPVLADDPKTPAKNAPWVAWKGNTVKPRFDAEWANA
jgi:hypothetical protein